ncbi:MAG: hypothetical protein ACRDRJ_17525 [Streptosporangiaceae bacterium]
MARLPGVRMLGSRRDPLGRPGYAFGTGRRALGEIAIIDPSTGSLLVSQGRVWRLVPARALGRGRYSITLPKAVAGQSVSLRVQAADSGGSGVEQTIITAYRG